MHTINYCVPDPKMLSRRGLLAFALVLVHSAVCKYFILGPAEVHISRIADCTNGSLLPMTGDFSLRMYNKTTQLLNATMRMPFDMDDTIGLSLRCSKMANNKWVDNSYTIEEDNACEALNKYVGGLWHDIESQLGMAQGRCPIKKGTYASSNVYLDLSKMKIQMFFDGQFKSRIRFMKYSRAVFCKDFTLSLRAKKNS